MRLVAIVVSNGATSLVSLIITITIGRQDGPGPLGVFGVSFAVLSLVQLFAREIGLNRALSNPLDLEQRQIAYSRSLYVALVIAIPMIIVGIILKELIVAITGFAVPGYVAFTFLRLLTMTDGKLSRGFIADAILLISAATICVVVISFDLSSIAVLVTWALALLCGMFMMQDQLGLRLRFGWYSSSRHYAGISFAIQSLFGSGAVHVTTFVLAGIFGPVLVGAIRGASTLLGPVNLITTSMSTLSIRQLAIANHGQRRRAMLRWLATSTGVALAGMFITWVIIAYFGAWILGESWTAVEPLIPWVILDALLVATAVAPRSAHRVDKRGAAAWKVSIVSGVARLVLLPLGGSLSGALGVAVASALTSLISACFWWLSYTIYRFVDEKT